MKYSFTFLATLFFSLASLCGEELSYNNLDLQESKAPYYGRIYYDNVFPAEIKEEGFRHEKLRYQIAGVNAGSVFFHNSACEEGLTMTLGYDWVYLCWKDNPSFDQYNFYDLNFSLSGFSKRVKDWMWKTNVTMHIDPDHFNNWSHYLAWDLLMWGRYEYSQNIGIHIGFYAITGMNINRVYPVLGVDWSCICWRPLKLSLVFPFDVSALWKINDCWEAGFAARFFQSRRRVKKEEPLSRGLWLYSAYGGEFVVNYHYSDFIHANIHAGTVFGGDLKIANRHWNHSEHFKTGYAPYFGAEISLAY